MPRAPGAASSLIERGLWEACGLAIVLAYLAVTALAKEIYRPRGLELTTPAFYLLVALPLAPIITQVIEQRRRRRQR